MFPFLYFLTLIYLPKIQPVSVRIDGMVELGQNWNFDWKAAAREGTPTTDSADPDVVRAGPSQPLNDSQQQPYQRSRTLASNSDQLSETPITSTIKKLKRKHRHKNIRVETFTLPTFTFEMNSEPDKVKVSTTPFHKLEVNTHKARITHQMETPAKIKKHMHLNSKRTTRQQIKTINAQNVIPVLPFNQPSVNVVAEDAKSILNLLAILSKTNLTTVATFDNVERTEGYEQDRVTMYYYKQPTKDHHHNPVFKKPHYVKDDVNIQNFTLQIFKQSLAVFDAMKVQANNSKLKNKVDFIAQSYRDKFTEFVKEIQNYKIKTSSGTQRVILNTIETSNNIMRRLLNFMIGDMEKKGVLRSDDGVSNLWQYDVENEEQQEYISACQKFNICRSKRTFSSFVADFLTILLQVDDKKLKQAIDALTEVMKFADMGRVFDKKVLKEFRNSIDIIERMEPNLLRPSIWMMRNTLINKNKPLVVQENFEQGVVDRSIALIDMIDILDEKIPASDENLLEWNELRGALAQWARGQRNNIMEIMTAFFEVILRKAVLRMNSKMASDFQEKVSIIFSARS